MTVRELIEALSKFDNDDVVFFDYDAMYFEVAHVQDVTTEEHHFVDSKPEGKRAILIY